MARRPRYKQFVRIRRVGLYWKAYYGWTVDRFFSLSLDLGKLAAECAAAFPGDAIEMPPPEVIAEGLPPDYGDVTWAVAEWLGANPTLNPALLKMAFTAQLAESGLDLAGLDLLGVRQGVQSVRTQPMLMAAE